MNVRATVACMVAAVVVWPVAALAQMGTPDATPSAPFGMPMETPLYFHAIMNQLEGRFGTNNKFRWSGEAWAGTDTNRLWIKSEGEAGTHGVQDSQQEIFYDRPITTYFDLQAGLRSDIDSRAGRTWAAFGVEGLAPYFFEVSATAYASDEGHYAAKLEGSTDLLITQRLILQPQIEMNFYSKNDPARAVDSGFSNLDAGLRLRYEITRKFAPYIGLTYESKFGSTANLVRVGGDKTSDLRFIVGVRVWL
ncbi:MAG: copper resistance protein B [Alphaproteobacteria bacterium]|nr:copper resistance protein B [Alphaproteobacteria bacterium]